jgi:hypothetical protein
MEGHRNAIKRSPDEPVNVVLNLMQNLEKCGMVREWHSLQHSVKFSIVEGRAGDQRRKFENRFWASKVRPDCGLRQTNVIEIGLINFQSYFA